MGKTILGQVYQYGFGEVPPFERLHAIRRAGFDAVMFWWGEEYEEPGASRYALFDAAERDGLLCRTVHFPTTHADWLWHDGLNGQSYEEQFLCAIRDCGEREIRNIVVHTTKKTITPPPNEVGTERFRRLCDAAEQANVVIAVENTRFLEYNRHLFGQIKSPAVGFCFDCGHANCFTPGKDPLGEFGSLLVTTHIHDNDGTGDQHHPMGEGNVDYADVFTRLRALDAPELNLESICDETCALYGKVSAEEYLTVTCEKLRQTAQKYGFELA